LEAVARDEMGHLFDDPPRTESLRPGEVFAHTFRYLGPVRGGSETFYLFIRLDPYEQTELMRRSRQTREAAAESGAGDDARAAPAPRESVSAPNGLPPTEPSPAPPAEPASRPRRATDP
ncbi:MAG: hypothetical protein LC672_07095, partial [Acidobacteria bacterium]|nr:hypothetical protein [Acidobacteriota bacterium]